MNNLRLLYQKSTVENRIGNGLLCVGSLLLCTLQALGVCTFMHLM